MAEKVVVGMSGGVDSSVAAYLLKQQGYDVIGVTMQIWQDESLETIADNGGCCGLSAVDDARRVAQILDIPYYVMNFKDIFKETVMDYFADAYRKGLTPNPCIACNRHVKWESLLQKALQIGADYIATGHYAEVCTYPDAGRKTLRISRAIGKDQTYALYNLTPFQLEHTLMPLWAYSKAEVRAIAEGLGLCVARKPDSQEICFIPGNDYAGFLQSYTGEQGQPGDFVDTNGQVLGRHPGIIHYTVGQRKGLGIAFGKPMYVKAIRPEGNQVVLAENDALFTSRLYAGDLNLMAVESISEPIRAKGKIRYSHKPAPCTIWMERNRLVCDFDEPQRAITPGQSAVFYVDDYIICGGTIV